MEQRELTLAPESVGLRLDRWLAEQCPDLSRSQLQNLIEAGSVTCNGSPLNKKDKLKAGQTILLTLPDPQPIEAQPQNIPLDIVYEDDSLLVVNKPKGTARGGCPASAGPSALALCIALIRIPAAFWSLQKRTPPTRH